jgi:hypothetical protein
MPETVFSSPGYVCATWKNIVINVLSGELEIDAVWAGHQAGSRIEVELGPRVGVLTVILPTMKLPSARFRREAARAMHEARHRTLAAATVIPGRGFKASAFRTAFATLNLASRSNLKTLVESECEPAAQFLLERTGDAEDASAAPADVRALVDAAAALTAAAEAAASD